MDRGNVGMSVNHVVVILDNIRENILERVPVEVRLRTMDSVL